MIAAAANGAEVSGDSKLIRIVGNDDAWLCEDCLAEWVESVTVTTYAADLVREMNAEDV